VLLEGVHQGIEVFQGTGEMYILHGSRSLLVRLSGSPGHDRLLGMTEQGTATMCRWSGGDIHPPSLVEALSGLALGPLAEAIVGDRRGLPVVPDIATEAVSEWLCDRLVCRSVVHGQSLLF
jgi:hypothetical protein